jgi:hypothetical protein
MDLMVMVSTAMDGNGRNNRNSTAKEELTTMEDDGWRLDGDGQRGMIAMDSMTATCL